MLKVLGFLLFVAGTTLMGLSAVASLRERVTCLRGFLGALELMERELSFNLTAVPELFSRLARSAEPPANKFFACCAKGFSNLGERSVEEIWRSALSESRLPLGEDESETLRSVGQVLGRYDGEGQQAVIMIARESLGRSLVRAESDRERLSRVYGALGLTGGIFLALIIL